MEVILPLVWTLVGSFLLLDLRIFGSFVSLLPIGLDLWVSSTFWIPQELYVRLSCKKLSFLLGDLQQRSCMAGNKLRSHPIKAKRPLAFHPLWQLGSTGARRQDG